MLRTAVAIACVAALAMGPGRPRGGPALARSALPAGGPAPVASEGSICPEHTLPDGDACVRLPNTETDDEPGAPAAESVLGVHRDKHGQWAHYDEIPRRPDRPADYDLYRYPVACDGGCVVSGYDLDRSDESQRRVRQSATGATGRTGFGATRLEVGHGGIDLVQPRGTRVSMPRLDHQEGDAVVVFVGTIFGTTVVSRHSLREGGQLRDYLMFFGHLEAPAAGVVPGAPVREGDLVGLVGDSGSPERVHLHLEVRRVRSGVALDKVAPQALLAADKTVVCDPRNVLPLRNRTPAVAP